ncbi:phosphatase PAP2 family protein [Bogoriella caseilytica]|uniref:PAP2 superfamily protein n=1 Tax=Bogoriella caseilytica TaxID=56055 RepID=A0A3N2BD39_9MICO|nr:phosphatase PAP2 family protein [Bogoriella caseilytica]ROR73145.1 PAP2 superfamily protein [Bogoriella caseilytica]
MTSSSDEESGTRLRSWTHDTGGAEAGGAGRRTRFYSEYEPRFESLTDGFDRHVLDRSFPSDGHGGHDFIPLLRGFDVLLEDHPEILERDRAQVVEISRQARSDPRLQDMARQGQYEDQLLTLHTGLGEQLGPVYLECMLAGKAPRTYQLLSKYRPHGRVGGEGASCNPAKAHWADRSLRPYLQVADQLESYDFDDGDAHAGLDGSFPSGHTSEAYWQGLMLATFLPEVAAGILARTADAGHSRAVMGAHFPLDIIGGRIMGSYIAANRWSDREFRPLLLDARAELRSVLEAECGAPLAEVAKADQPYLSDGEARRWYRSLLTYGFPQIGDGGQRLEIPAEAPALLLGAHPSLDEQQRADVLRATAVDSGYPLDIRGEHGGWQRLDLMAAMTARVTVGADGAVQVH